MHPIADIESEPIFSCEVHERDKMVVRNVYEMPLTPKNIRRFWELASPFKMLFWEPLNGDFKKFLEIIVSQEGESLFANGLFWVIDDFVGIYYMTAISRYDAQIHYTFFDRRHWGRHEMTRQMIKYVFNKYNFQRLSAEIPRFRKGTFEFIKQLGMKLEGTKREAAWYNGEWYDVECWGILKREADKWNIDTPQVEMRLENV